MNQKKKKRIRQASVQKILFHEDKIRALVLSDGSHLVGIANVQYEPDCVMNQATGKTMDLMTVTLAGDWKHCIPKTEEQVVQPVNPGGILGPDGRPIQ